jgi:transketolase
MSASTNATLTAAQLDQLSIDTIRFLSLDGMQKADSGHSGLPLGTAPYVLCIVDTVSPA